MRITKAMVERKFEKLLKQLGREGQWQLDYYMAYNIVAVGKNGSERAICDSARRSTREMYLSLCLAYDLANISKWEATHEKPKEG